MNFGGKKKKEMNEEVDLVAFISLLSVCICFLLLTTIWIQIASMNVKQAVGGQPADEAKPKPELWVMYDEAGNLKFNLRNSPQKLSRKYDKVAIQSKEGKPDLEKLGEQIAELKTEYADLGMALIRPTEKTMFEDIITVMDIFRDKGISDLGVTPL